MRNMSKTVTKATATELENAADFVLDQFRIGIAAADYLPGNLDIMTGELSEALRHLARYISDIVEG